MCFNPFSLSELMLTPGYFFIEKSSQYLPMTKIISERFSISFELIFINPLSYECRILFSAHLSKKLLISFMDFEIESSSSKDF